MGKGNDDQTGYHELVGCEIRVGICQEEKQKQGRWKGNGKKNG